MIVVRVALPVPLRQHFDYLISTGLEPQPGCRVLVPFGNRKLVGLIWQLSPPDSYDTSKLKQVLSLLDTTPVLPVLLCQLLSFAADYYHHPLGEVLISALPALLREGRNLSDYQPKAYRLTDTGRQLDPAALKRSQKQQGLWQALHVHPLSESVLLQQHSRATLKQLLDKLLIEEQLVPASPFTPPGDPAAGLRLTSAQALAVTAVTQAFGRFERLLLEGVTGSGKTEVYLQAIAPVLAKGQQVLVLVPEIGLTPQTLARFEKRFAVPMQTWLPPRPFWQAARPSPMAMWLLPVPLLPTAMTFSRRSTYSERASSSTNVFLSDGSARKSKLSRLLTAGADSDGRRPVIPTQAGH